MHKAEIKRRLEAGQDMAAVATVLGCRFAEVKAVRDSLPRPMVAAEIPLAALRWEGTPSDKADHMLSVLDSAGIVTVGDFAAAAKGRIPGIGEILRGRVAAELAKLGLSIDGGLSGQVVVVDRREDAVWEYAAGLQTDWLVRKGRERGPLTLRLGRSALAIRGMPGY